MSTRSRSALSSTLLCLSWLALGSGCQFIDDTKDAIEGVLQPTVAVGVVARIEAPDDPRIDLSQLDVSAGLGATVFLADAAKASEIENAPIKGATLSLAGCSSPLLLQDQNNGSYVGLPTDNPTLASCEGPFTLSRADANADFTYNVELPDPVTVEIPTAQNAGEDLVLDLSDQGWGSAYVAVYSLESGGIVWSNQPEDVMGYYQLLTGNQDLSVFTIPGATFEAESDYILLLTGLVKIPNAGVKHVNTALSVIDAGRAVPYFITTRVPG